MDHIVAGPRADSSPYRPPDQPPGTDPRPTRDDPATRYLCVAAYRDEAFRRAVFEQVFEQPHKAMAPLYGVNLATVVAHCVAARHRTSRRAVATIGFALLGFILGSLLGAMNGLLPEDTGVVALVGFVLGAWLTVFAFDLTLRTRVFGGQLSRDKFDSHEPPGLPARMRAAVDARTQQLEGNVVVHGGYLPFAGAGWQGETWSFALDVTKPRMEFGVPQEPQPIEVRDLIRHVTDAVASSGIPETRIRGEVYVRGTDVRVRTDLLPDLAGPPATRLPASELEALMDGESGPLRYYTHISVSSADRELTLSLFFRFSRVGKNLFTEATFWVLPPSSPRYRDIDRMAARPASHEVAEIAVRSFVVAPFVAIGALFRPLAAYTEWAHRRGARKLTARELRENPSYDYGATISIRESGAVNQYDRYFQQADREKYGKILARQLLSAIASYLELRGIDTSELVEQRQAILNTGVIFAGSSIQGDNVVVGQSVKARLKSLGGAKRTAGATKAGATAK